MENSREATGWKGCIRCGGVSGIGLGQAKVLAEEARRKVAIADVQYSYIDEVKAHFANKNVDVHVLKSDITDRSAFAAARDEVGDVFGPVEDAAYDDWDSHVNVNLTGVIIELARATMTPWSEATSGCVPFRKYIQRIETGTKELIEAMIPWLDHPDYAVLRAAELAALAG
jgi:short chain dehydrogenase